MEEVFCTQALPPKCLLDFGEQVNNHWRDQYSLSIDETTQLPPRMEGTIVYG